jgi:A/G-specific adenine glycosylase
VIAAEATIDIHALRSAMFRWYRHHGRELPWRATRDPYAVLVSEFMLQQTQVTTVLPYYERWLKRFPNFAALAAASENDVLHAWQGLGYYTRARNLHATAKIIQDRHSGKVPREPHVIRTLPGIGRYTANAISSFAFDTALPIVEANTARLLTRLFNIRIPIDTAAGLQKLWVLAARLTPRRQPSRFNAALMDLGALVCVARNPKCDVCPVKTFCRARAPGSLPRKRPRAALQILVEAHAFIARADQIFLEQCRQRWRGMWMLPPFRGRSTTVGAIYSEVFAFTTHRITLDVFRSRGRKVENRQQRWFCRAALASIPIPTPHRRAIEELVRRPNVRAHEHA